ncbi:PREDICTED: uncharacterized protein LOC105449358 [Wasmannia auropunctata]|uniref:uncharacterized protein LOC105449358 n=1 Tax=Wasmannia auropunctata TaxID=64793 RepID=UPI0005EE9915|nr:PREDICTED: uncharacterized protein LOC105449358 [Wasmannia auropunctata]
MKKKHKRLQREYRTKIRKLQQEVGIQKHVSSALKNLLNNDQIKMLGCEYKKMPKWCDSTLVKAYQLKFSCGQSGYKELLKHGFPLPSLRTLNQKLENLKFQSEILHKVFEFLHIKISQLKNDRDRDCLLVLDEINISASTVFDISTNTYVGCVILPQHNNNDIATYGLVFMFASIGHRWKQSVAYYFTAKKRFRV